MCWKSVWKSWGSKRNAKVTDRLEAAFQGRLSFFDKVPERPSTSERNRDIHRSRERTCGYNSTTVMTVNADRRIDSRSFVSFFSGALGLDLGLECAGLKPLAANEFDPAACATIRRNRPNLRLYDCDIRLLTSARLIKDLGLQSGGLFAVVGGPPCQAFSTAGTRLGLNDERGNVFLHFVNLIADLKPKYAIFENVRGLLSAPLKHRPHDQRGKAFPPLQDDELPGGALLHIITLLEKSGYTTSFNLYNTANYGVPQIRERLVFFASRDGRSVPYIPPFHDEHGRNGLPYWKTLRESMEGVGKTGIECGKFPAKRLRYFRMLRQGQNWRDLPSHLQREAMGASYEANGGKTGFYRRLGWDKPAPTLVSRPTMPATALCHPTKLRPLSVAEYAAIQTFPPDYSFEGKTDEKYRQIGNAVPVTFGKAIGEHLLKFDAGMLDGDQILSRLSRYKGTDHESWRQSVMSNQSCLF
jgi:DNA (cytosine-5)-methyltransferase 1